MSVHDKFSHIDQLAEWWENAEESDDFYPGDTWIKRRQAQTGGYVYDVGRVTGKRWYFEARVLTRAPKPKPAWHGAVAVIASHVDSTHRSTWTPDPFTPGMWITDDDQRHAEDLRDVTPLIEAEVTDEMVERGAQAGTPAGVRYLRPHEVREVLTAALGIEEGS